MQMSGAESTRIPPDNIRCVLFVCGKIAMGYDGNVSSDVVVVGNFITEVIIIK